MTAPCPVAAEVQRLVKLELKELGERFRNRASELYLSGRTESYLEACWGASQVFEAEQDVRPPC